MTDPSTADERPAAAADEPIDTRLVRRLADILNDTGLTTIDVERGDLKIRVARERAAPATTVVGPAPPPAPPAGAAPPLREDLPPAATGHVVKSPMVGTVYLQPQPGSPAFVRVGDTVGEGQTLCIIEAMKTMNPIAAGKAGVLRAFMIADGQPVEYGEPLAVID